MTDAITIQNPRNRGGSTGHVLAKRSVTFTEIRNQAFVRALSDAPSIYKQGCDSWYQNADLQPCIYGGENAQKTAVLIGDSIGAQWLPALERALDPAQWRLIVLTKSSCPMVDEPYFYARIGREYTECAEWREKAIEWLQQQPVDRLFIGSTASNAFTDEQWQEGTRRILDKLAGSAQAIFLIEANPTLSMNGPQCLMRHGTDHQTACQTPAGPAQYICGFHADSDTHSTRIRTVIPR